VKVFMLGWEFPPVVSGGLGVACYGLVKALNAAGTDVLFLLPRPASAKNGRERQKTREVHVASPHAVHNAVERAHEHAHHPPLEPHHHAPPPSQPAEPHRRSERVYESGPLSESHIETDALEHHRFQRVTFVPLDSPLTPYQGESQYQRMIVEEVVEEKPVKRWEKRFERHAGQWIERIIEDPPADSAPPPPPPPPKRYLEGFANPPPVVGGANGYAGDLFSETDRYARLALSVAKGESFDIVHAHEWMTFEAAMAVAAESGKPLVVQIHSTEMDRAGYSANPRIIEAEREGMLAADRVIAVSQRTKDLLVEKYGIPAAKISVIHNAPADMPQSPAAPPPRAHKPTVLFLGRLVRHKGPDYFLRAAQRVLAVEADIRFVLAGQGDMLPELKQLAADLGIRRSVTFTGHLNKKRAAELFACAALYVMPSVSEPFGIASLDALSHDVPVIISRQSGVAEVLKHVLKVDFWDTDELANKILAILRHPPLATTLRTNGRHESRQFTWPTAANEVLDLYHSLMPTAPAP
jgi:glycosyltransferase involved in cell wall biosynthesis